jgi:hypothetical protein
MNILNSKNHYLKLLDIVSLQLFYIFNANFNIPY